MKVSIVPALTASSAPLAPLDLVAAHPWRRAVFTTCALGLSFFEAVILDALVSGLRHVGGKFLKLPVPISLVVNKGATKRVRKARSLTVAQFRALLSELREPFSTLALLCVCLGLRMSEALALRWSDVDWLGSRLSIKRGIVERVVDEVKTEASAKMFVLAGDLFARLKAWKQVTRFSGTEEWIFASPVKIGRLPYSYTGVWRDLQRAADASGIGRLAPTLSGTHTAVGWMQ